VRIGLLGGSFDPVHFAHLTLAKTALHAVGLDQVWFVPAGQPWQKPRKLISAQHRVEMLQQAIADNPAFRLELCEVERQGPSFTFETVMELSERMPHVSWTLILGQDQYERLVTWHRWQQLISMVELAVACRLPANEVGTTSGSLPNRVTISQELQNLPVTWLPMAESNISSTLIRQRINHRMSLEGWVPEAVAQYIERHGLYTSCT
jgi:nicotinate-nucleotide adenylyltransferase